MVGWGYRGALRAGTVLLVLVSARAFSLRHDPPPAAITSADLGCKPQAIFRVRWERPGVFFPVLGWREPVDLKASECPVDRQLAHLAADSFNCHYYTRFQIRRARGETILPVPRQDLITMQWLRSYRYEPVTGPAAEGDVLLALRPDGAGGWSITHSGIVLEVDASGRPSRIRQKFDDRHPVIDVNGEEFRMLYAGQHPWHVQAWRAAGVRPLVTRL